ncbi:phage integrase central domain-containing protein [Nocardia brasiliensis]|uniref:phage integrase central domain-containing protein n=1 Tax=Nocardia brasiliensis TaxID=37326 RepID=UPI003D78EDA4
MTIEDARGWLSIQQAAIISKTWKPPTARQPTKQTFKAYADNWLEHRKLADRTREDYRGRLDAHILPALGSLPLSAFDDREIIDNWYQKLNPDTPTLRARVYSLASTIFNSAVADRAKTGLTVNPCRIRGAASVSPRHRVRPADLAELEALTLAMPTRYRAMVLLAAWCALRFGELTELRRCDVDWSAGRCGSIAE